jgi:hypothetical protein
MARGVTTQRKIINTAAAWAIGLLIFFPILWIIVLSFKTEADAIKTPFEILTGSWTFESYLVVQERSDYFKHFWNDFGCFDWSAGGMVNGFCALKTDKGHLALDALHQDAAGCWGALSYVSLVHPTGPFRHSYGIGDCFDADQPAYHHLDALHLFS